MLAFLLALSLIGAHADDKPAVETAQTGDLQFRGQGPAGICFAFAEEQLMKDAATPTQEENAAEWKYSIFDIILAHRAYDTHGYMKKIDALNAERLFLGAADSLPFASSTKSFSASHCTLEKDLFLISRSPLNGEYLMMDQLIPKLWGVLSSPAALPPKAIAEIEKLGVTDTVKTLTKLAVLSSDEMDFLRRVLTYRTCDEQVPIPQKQIHRVFAADAKTIGQTLDTVLGAGKSVLVDLCGIDLEDVKQSDECGPHAVVLKRAIDNDFVVVDSAFLSSRPRGTDGSIRMPKAVVIGAAVHYVALLQAPKPKPNGHDDPALENYDLLVNSDFTTFGTTLLDNWRQNPGVSSLWITVLNPPLLDCKSAKREEFKARMQNLDLISDNGIHQARLAMNDYLNSLEGDCYAAFTWSLAHEPWGSPLPEVVKASKNLTWFE